MAGQQQAKPVQGAQAGQGQPHENIQGGQQVMLPNGHAITLGSGGGVSKWGPLIEIILKDVFGWWMSQQGGGVAAGVQPGGQQGGQQPSP